MKAIVILFCFFFLQTNEDAKLIPSAVYNWNDMKVWKDDNQENRQIFQGSTAHMSYLDINATTLAGSKVYYSKSARNDDERLILVSQGELKITMEKSEKVIGKGGISLVMPGEDYQIENTGDLSAVFYIMNFRSKAAMSIDRGLSEGGSLIISRNEIEYNTHDKGGRWNYFDRPTASCTDFEVHATSLNTGVNSHAPHTHVQEEIILMLQGNAIMHIDGKDYKSSVGDVIFLDSEVPHGLTNSGSEPCEYFAFQWK